VGCRDVGMSGCRDVGHQAGITCRWQPRKGVMTTGDDEQLGHTNEHNYLAGDP